MKTNVKRKAPKTHEGATASIISPVAELERSVMACLLWEDTFYESGEDVTARILRLVNEVPDLSTMNIAVKARNEMQMRHAPLLIAAALAKKRSKLAGDCIRQVIQRADELTELLSLYWKLNGSNATLSAQLKKGLADAFGKFDAYQLAKYDRDRAIKLRDVLRLVHPTPKDEAQSNLWKMVKDRALPIPGTWENELSAGKDKRETFTRLITEGKLGYMALLRNLRNLAQAGVDRELVEDAILARKGALRVLPFRYFTAAKAAPMFEGVLDTAMRYTLNDLPKLPGKTVLVLDVSGSMSASLSRKSTLNRLDGGAALCAVIRGQCEDVAVYATAGSDFSRVHATELIPSRHGAALIDALRESAGRLGGGGIFLKPMTDYIKARENDISRVIVVTDEQDCAIAHEDSPSMAAPFGSVGNYILNVGSYQNGIAYGNWTHITGFSENVVRYIMNAEQPTNN